MVVFNGFLYIEFINIETFPSLYKGRVENVNVISCRAKSTEQFIIIIFKWMKMI